MSSAAADRGPRAASVLGESSAARAGLRRHPGVVALVLGGSAVAWWSTSTRMAGMDAGPGTDPGALGWFMGVWVVMMAAMMLPSLAPTAALLGSGARTGDRVRPFAFAGGYLLAWALPGLAAYGLYALGRAQLSDALSWHAGGRWTAGAVLLLAAAYELTPVKRAFLSRCRRLPRPPRAGPAAALAAGAAHAGWCVGCCLGLMTALFALGVMSLTWMIVLAALVAVQKLLPWPGRATLASTAVLALLSAGLLASPQSVPGLVVPGSAHRHAGGAMQMPAAMHMPHAGHLPAAAHVRATAPAPAVKR